jgi:hypothetical protein
MEIARQWLARREILQLREDVHSSRELVEQGHGTSLESLGSASEARAPAGAAAATKKPRTLVIAGLAASVLVLCGVAMVVAFSRQVAPNTKPASVQLSRPVQAVLSAPSAAVPPQQASAIPQENAQKPPPPDAAPILAPKPKPTGPSLPEALALIADKVGGEGTVNFTVQSRDIATGHDQYEQRLYKASNITADPKRCEVRYHWHAEHEGITASDQGRTVELRLARSVRLTPIDGEPGRRSFVRAYPKVHVVQIAGRNNASGHSFYFYNKDTAARVVTSIRHAVELCGKGRPPSRER